MQKMIAREAASRLEWDMLETFARPTANNLCHNLGTGRNFGVHMMTRSKKPGLCFNP
jgi:hypothetical protein